MKFIRNTLILAIFLSLATTAFAADFVESADGTVTDRDTGLIWQQGEPGAMTWEQGLAYAAGLTLAGYDDWRLPNIKELESITDDTESDPAINTTYFPSTYSAAYWSSTTLADNTDFAWYVYFNNGFGYGIVYYDFKTSNYYVRCVRGGE